MRPLRSSSSLAISIASNIRSRHSRTALVNRLSPGRTTAIEPKPNDSAPLPRRSITRDSSSRSIALTKAVLPKMLAQKNGQIVTMSSLVGIFGFPQRSSYSASKHALHGFYATLMVEHYNDNLKINIICPGRIKTDISINSLTKDGTQHGKMDQGQAKGISAEKCAQIIVKAMKRNKRVTVIGMEGKLMVFFKKFIPTLFYKIASNISAT